MNEIDDLVRQIEGLSPAEQEKLRASVESAPVWVPNPGPQTMAYFSEADEIYFGGQAGGGKLTRCSELILTPKGFVLAGDLRVGDLITSPATGGSTKVIGVFPQGVKELYRFTFDDGAVLDTGLEHYWTYRGNGHDCVRPYTKASAQRDFAEAYLGVKSEEPSGWKVGTTAEIIAHMDAGGRPRIPLTFPVAFTKYWRPWKVDPYLIGLLLGDGHHKSFTITNIDEEIVNYCLGTGEFRFDGAKTLTMIPGKQKNNVRAHFERYGQLNCRSWEKFIPRSLKFAAIPERLAVLQGLMDTDGTVDDRGRSYFTSVSKQLAQDVQFIVRSLGGKARIKSRVPTYGHKGEKKSGRVAYTVRCWLPKSSALFRLTRKKGRCTDSWNGGYELSREIVEYKHVGQDEAVCIAVDHPSHLYLAGEDLVVTHNTDLGIGLAITQHKKSLLLRRYLSDAEDLAERTMEITGSRDGYNGQSHKLRLPERTLDFGGVKEERDKERYKGNPHDLIFFDELPDFLKSQYDFIIGWNRSVDPNQRCRVLGAGNPPTQPEGLWVIGHWGAWLDPNHPKYPTPDGVLRWYLTDDAGNETEVDGPGPHTVDGKEMTARSRTFIRSRLSDNPDLAATDYDAVLSRLPPELRAAYRDGRFDLGLKDRPYQVIPTLWIREAFARWKPDPPDGVPMCAIGVDVAQGGDDQTILAPRHDGWYAPFIAVDGKATPDGPSVAGLVMSKRRHDAMIIIDMGGGFGGSAFDHLKANGIACYPYKGAEKSLGRTQDGQLKFVNKRSHAYWLFREALDPGQYPGSRIALPTDNELLADLAAPCFTLTPNGIKITPKEELVKTLGRSPDKGDAVVMAWYKGNKAETHGSQWRREEGIGTIRRTVSVNYGKRRR